MLPAGDAAKGYIAAGLQMSGSNFPVIQEIAQVLYSGGKKGNLNDPKRIGRPEHFSVTVRDRTPPTFTFVASGAVPPAEGETVHLEMRSAQDLDPDFPRPDAFYWMVLLPRGGFVEDFNQSFDFTPGEPGTFEVRYECRDPSNNVRSGNWTFFAADTSGPLWAPPVGLTVSDGANLTLSAEDATDYSGVAGVVWQDGALGISTNLSFERTWTGLGNHTVSATLLDLIGNEALYIFTVTVVDRTAPRLSDLNFTRAVSVKQGAAFELDAAGAFADNDPAFSTTALYLWSTDAPDVTWGSATDISLLLVSFNRTGTFIVRLNVTDAAGNRVAVSFTVTVTDV